MKNGLKSRWCKKVGRFAELEGAIPGAKMLLGGAPTDGPNKSLLTPNATRPVQRDPRGTMLLGGAADERQRASVAS